MLTREEEAELSRIVDDLCALRHEQGEVEYGHLTYLTADLDMMYIEELADARNYLKYMMIRHILTAQRKEQEEDTGIGPKSFTPLHGDKE